MNKCKYCGAIWRNHYPFGHSSRGVSIFQKEHQKGCPLKK